MLGTYFISCAIILGLLAGWLGVQYAARAFARRHPELGPAREDGAGCMFCLCKDRDQCPKRQLNVLSGGNNHPHNHDLH